MMTHNIKYFIILDDSASHALFVWSKLKTRRQMLQVKSMHRDITVTVTQQLAQKQYTGLFLCRVH